MEQSKDPRSRPTQLNKGAKAIQQRKGSPFNKLKNWTIICKKTKRNYTQILHNFTKINKWAIDLHVKQKTIKLLEENIEENLCDLEFDNLFLDTISKA